MKTRRLRSMLGIIIATTLASSALGCGTGTTGEGDEAPPEPQGTPAAERIALDNDEAQLASRVTSHNQTITLTTPTTDWLGIGAEPNFTLIAEVAPPEVVGHHVDVTTSGDVTRRPDDQARPLQATSVVIRNHTAVVSYHQVGEIYAGAVDVFDVRKPDRPRLTSFGRFEHMDINALTFDAGATAGGQAKGPSGDGQIYLAASTCDPLYQPYSAVVERIELSQYKLTLRSSYRFGLAGQVGTAAAVGNGTLYTTAGRLGGLTAFNPGAERRLGEAALSDARWVDASSEHVVVSEGGERSGTLSVYDPQTLQPLGRHAFSGGNVPDSKSTVQVVGQYAFVAAGPGGVQVIDLDDGRVVAEVPVPKNTGYLENEVVSNGLAVDGNLLFIANGGPGVYVVRIHGNAEDAAGSLALEMLGRLEVDGSVNHVAYHGNLLFLAAGGGGLKIIKVAGLGPGVDGL